MPMLAALFALAMSPASAAPGSAELRSAFGNTIVSTYPDGRKAELWLQPDGSYTAEGRRHDRSDGHWQVRGARICLRQSHPLTLPISYCTAVPSSGVGSEWSARAVTGEKIRVRLIEGRPAGSPGPASGKSSDPR
jgi:hypothetical protein